MTQVASTHILLHRTMSESQGSRNVGYPRKHIPASLYRRLQVEYYCCSLQLKELLTSHIGLELREKLLVSYIEFSLNCSIYIFQDGSFVIDKLHE